MNCTIVSAVTCGFEPEGGRVVAGIRFTPSPPFPDVKVNMSESANMESEISRMNCKQDGLSTHYALDKVFVPRFLSILTLNQS